MMPDLPTITLDVSLADLYRQASPRNAHKRIAQIFSGINSGSELNANVPRNAKYLYQDSPFNTVPKKDTTNGAAGDEEQQQLAVKYLSLIPQRDAFISGETDVVFFNINESDKQKAHDKREAEKTVAVLAPNQRPNLIFCPGPSKIPIKEAGIELIAYKLVLDGLEDYNLIVPPETHWFLNSKAALAQSGLPTPKSTILELNGLAGEASLCCTFCRGGDTEEFVIPQACSGVRGEWFLKESEKMFADIATHPLPFVLKNQQAFGGAGTYIINTEEERRQVVKDFRGGILRKLLSSVNDSNAHLRPAALILSDLVEKPIGDYGVTFFVTDDGSDPIFLATSEQMTDDGKAWIGSTINYAHQDELKKKFAPLVKRIAGWLRTYNYVGPAGADVLETAPSSGFKPATNGHGTNGSLTNGVPDEEGDFSNFHIVDLNVRTSGSLCLPLLKGHFTSRGLWSGSAFSISSKKRRDEFIALFRKEFETGKMCIIGWYEDPDTGSSLANVAVGAENEDGLRKAMKRVRDVTDEVTF